MPTDEQIKNLWFSIKSSDSVVNLQATEEHEKWLRYFLKYCKVDSAKVSARIDSGGTKPEKRLVRDLPTRASVRGHLF